MATLGPVAYSHGTMQLVQGKIEAASQALELALELATMRARPYIARSQAGLARALRLRDQPGDEERARALAQQATETARELGMTRLERTLRPDSPAAPTDSLAPAPPVVDAVPTGKHSAE
jgi:hypothetical protein